MAMHLLFPGRTSSVGPLVREWGALGLAMVCLILPGQVRGAERGVPKADRRGTSWKRGLPTEPSYFPIAVWLQDPANAERYKAAGINLYVGLWKGPTGEQLDQLRRAGISVICGQNEAGLTLQDHPSIVGWMHDDEPDNAQSLGEGKGYGPPVPTEKIVEGYRRMRNADPTRPILLNLGQGVAWDNYIGRGVRRNHPEDYPEYLQGCDIASFDIYPVVHDSPEVAGKLEFVAKGVERLSQWTRGQKPVWCCVECTHISNPSRKANPQQMRSEIWMALIRGARGLVYFVHQFQPRFREAALFDNPEMLAAVTNVNQEIRNLAPVLNSPTLDSGELAGADASHGPIAWMTKRSGKQLYLFAVNLSNRQTTGVFTLPQPSNNTELPTSSTVLREERTIPMNNGRWTDSFSAYEVHAYLSTFSP